MAHIFDIGTRAWQPDTTEGWVASEVTDKQIDGDKVTLVFQLENGEVRRPEQRSITPYLHCALTTHTEQARRDDAGRHPDRQ